MKNKNLVNIILIISIAILIGLGILLVVRNIPFGIAAVIFTTVVIIIQITLLIASATLKRKLWAMVCRIVVVCMLLYMVIVSFVSPSENEDAIFFMTIHIIVSTLAIVFGIFRRKIYNDNKLNSTK